MKKLMALLFMLMIAGCRSYNIDINNDPYLNKKTISMDMYHKSHDWREGQVWSGKYVRDIIKNELRPIVYCIELRCRNVTAEVASDAFIQIADEKHGLRIISRKEIIEHRITSEMWNSGSSRIITVCAEIDRIIEEKILNTGRIEYRLYVDKTPVTLTVDGRQLDSIKQFLNAR